MSKKEKVIVYIDGFNLYFGMTSMYKDVKWLNVRALSLSLLKEDQELIAVKYFTSRVANDPPKEKRQRTYLSALATTATTIIYGHYKSSLKSCSRCGHTWADNEEKMTDVNIAIQMMTDALEDKFDIAFLISGDSDLVPPITAVHHQFKGKRVIVGFPPNRHNNSVKNVARGSFIIGRSKLKKAQFPDAVVTTEGFTVVKPTNW